jgi:hypothetical protein
MGAKGNFYPTISLADEDWLLDLGKNAASVRADYAGAADVNSVIVAAEQDVPISVVLRAEGIMRKAGFTDLTYAMLRD